MSHNFKYENEQQLGSTPKESRVGSEQQNLANGLSASANGAPPQTKNKLLQQHLKLKSQLRELAQKMDEIALRERERKQKKNHPPIQQQSQHTIQLRKVLKAQQLKMLKIKSQIAKLRKNMDNKYDLNRIVDKQNQLKHLHSQLKCIQQQRQSLQKIRRTQDKAIRIEDDREGRNKKNRMEEELRQVGAQNKKNTEIINEKQKQIRKLHQAFITKSQKAKEIQAKINQKKKGQGEITPEMVEKLEDELKSIEEERDAIEKEGNQKIRVLEKQKKQLRYELERKKLILEEKEKQLRLNQMKHKQIVRLINSSHQQSIAESRVEKQNKDNGKRVVAKKGREAPKIDVEEQEKGQQAKSDVLSAGTPQPELQNKAEDQNQQKQQENANEMEKDKDKKQKHDYGFSANLDDQIIDDS